MAAVWRSLPALVAMVVFLATVCIVLVALPSTVGRTMLSSRFVDDMTGKFLPHDAHKTEELDYIIPLGGSTRRKARLAAIHEKEGSLNGSPHGAASLMSLDLNTEQVTMANDSSSSAGSASDAIAPNNSAASASSASSTVAAPGPPLVYGMKVKVSSQGSKWMLGTAMLVDTEAEGTLFTLVPKNPAERRKTISGASTANAEALR